MEYNIPAQSREVSSLLNMTYAQWNTKDFSLRDFSLSFVSLPLLQIEATLAVLFCLKLQVWRPTVPRQAPPLSLQMFCVATTSVLQTGRQKSSGHNDGEADPRWHCYKAQQRRAVCLMWFSAGVVAGRGGCFIAFEREVAKLKCKSYHFGIH